MHGFVSHYTNNIDSKGRVSIPAPFRTVLARDGFEGLYCFPSPYVETVDAGGNGLLDQISAKLNNLDPLSEEHDIMSTALFGNSEILKVDGEGRVSLSEGIRHLTGIERAVTFVGMGYKFQIWEPSRFDAHRDAAKKRALDALSRPRTGA